MQAWNFTELSIELVIFYQFLTFLELLSQRRYVLETVHIVPPVSRSLNSWAVGQVLKRKGLKKDIKFPYFVCRNALTWNEI